MYKKHFGLSEEPFSLTPDPAFLFPSEDHMEALAGLALGVRLRRGFIVMTGEVGTGKTTLLYSLLKKLESRMQTAYISNTRLRFREILRAALKDFGVACPGNTKAELIETLNGFLARRLRDGVTATLVIDGAQDLPKESFEDLRLLSNFETYKSKPLQIVLVGQPELRAKLSRTTLRQVAERVTVHLKLTHLTAEQSRLYIQHRLRATGGSPNTFTRSAMSLAARKSGGIPRRINIICHDALLFAYGKGLSRVNRAAVRALLRRTTNKPNTFARRLSCGPAHYLWRTSGWRRPWGRIGAAAGIAAVATVVAIRLPCSSRPGTHQPLVASLTKPTHVIGTTQLRNRVTGGTYRTRSVFRKGEEGDPFNMGVQQVPTVRRSLHGARTTEDVTTPAVNKVNGMAGKSQPAKTGAVVKTGSLGLENLLAAEPHPQAASHDPSASYLVQVKPGQALYTLTRSIYGTYTQDLLRAVQRANPHIVNPNHILAGDRLRFPRLNLQQTTRARLTQPATGGKL